MQKFVIANFQRERGKEKGLSQAREKKCRMQIYSGEKVKWITLECVDLKSHLKVRATIQT